MHRRALLLAAVATTLAPTLALADERIAGQWQAEVGKDAFISMAILADGYWTSETVHNKKVVAQMAGTYKQKGVNATSGTLVFTPTPSETKVSKEHGAATVETDHYSLQDGGKVLRLTTEGTNDVMVFHKQPFAK